MTDFLDRMFEDAGGGVGPNSGADAGSGTVADLGPVPVTGVRSVPRRKKNRRPVSEADGDPWDEEDLAAGTEALSLPDGSDPLPEPEGTEDALLDLDDGPDAPDPGPDTAPPGPTHPAPSAAPDEAAPDEAAPEVDGDPSEDPALLDDASADSDGEIDPNTVARVMQTYRVPRHQTTNHAVAESGFARRVFEGLAPSNPGRVRFHVGYDTEGLEFSLVSHDRVYERHGLTRDQLRRTLKTLNASTDPRGATGADAVSLSPYSGFRSTVYVPENRIDRVVWEDVSPESVVGRLTESGGNYLLTVTITAGRGNRQFAFNGDARRMRSILTLLQARTRDDGGPDGALRAARNRTEGVEMALSAERVLTVGKSYANQITWR